MSNFALKLANSTWNTSLKGLRLPSRTKLAGEYLLGVSQAESVKNRANPSLPLTVQDPSNQIVYNAHSAVVRSSASAGYGFLTGIIPYDDHTLIVVRKNSAIGGTQPHIIGCRDSSGIRLGMQETGGGVNVFHNGEGNIIDGAQRTAPAAGVIYFEAGVGSVKNPQTGVGGLGTLYYYSGGTQQVATSAVVGSSDIRGRPQIYIGSNNLLDSVTTNTEEVFFVAIYQRPLSSSEIDAAYNAIVAYYSTLGVTVV